MLLFQLSVYDHRVDIGGAGSRYDELGRVETRGDVRHAHQDQIGLFSRRQRADAGLQPCRPRAFARGPLQRLVRPDRDGRQRLSCYLSIFR